MRHMHKAMLANLIASSIMYAAPKGANAGAGKPPAPPAPPVPEAPQPVPATPVAAAAAQATTAAYSFTIDSDIPFPVGRSNLPARESMYPFKALAVGQSFFVPVTERLAEPWKALTSIASRQARELHPVRFKTERRTENGQDGIRVWRIEDTTEPLKEPIKRNKPAQTGTDAQQQTEAQAGASVTPPPPPAPVAA